VPDIILLTETWCNPSTSDASLALMGYKLETELRRDRTDTANGIGGGLLVYARDNVQILPYDKHSKSEFNQFCEFSIVTNREKLNVILTYRPPSSGPANTASLCEILRSLDSNTVLIGDINLPGVNWTENQADSKGRELLNTVTEESLQQMVSFPTHLKGNTLDLVITNCPERIIDITDQGRLGRSDHCILHIVMESQLHIVSRDQAGRNWRKANMEALQSELASVPWEEELTGKQTEEAWLSFRKVLDTAIEKHVPLTRTRCTLNRGDPADDKEKEAEMENSKEYHKQ